MSEVYCPMCGKPNPADVEICQFCDARLKPLQILSSDDDLLSSQFGATGKDEEIPDWLASLGEPGQAQSEPSSEAGSVPDWLNGLREESSEESGELHFSDEDNFASVDLGGDRQIPEWLKGILPDVDLPDAELEQAEVGDAFREEKTQLDWSPDLEEQGESDWLAKKEEQPIAEGLSSSTKTTHVNEVEKEELDISPVEEPLENVLETPDWISSAEQSLRDEESLSDAPERLPETSLQTASEPQDIPDDAFSWLTSSLEPQPPKSDIPEDGIISALTPDQLTASASILADSNVFVDSEQPGESSTRDLSWLDEMESDLLEIQAGSEDFDNEPSAIENLGNIELATALPDWLKQATPAEESIGSPALTSEAGAELASAELPGWLKSMRPTESRDFGTASRGAENEQLEGSGPLAGFKGVLPAEPDIVQATKPPIYSTKLNYTDLQQSQAGILADLIQVEGEARPLPAPPLFTSQSLLRISIALVLFAVLLYSLITGAPLLSQPALNPDVFTANQLLVDLPGGMPVLVAVDTSPGFTGELGVTLSAVLDHLVSKGEFLTMVSTVPTGPLQVEYFINQLKSRSGIPQDLQYVNLGFIPGGPSGIRAFVENPQITLPSDIQGNRTWQQPPLQGIRTLADFAMLIVATENHDTARMWIEQVHPAIGNTPMVLVVSAQNEPLIRPYYDAKPRQFQGLLSGYSAAVQYNSILGRKDGAVARWSPFMTGLTAAVLLMVICSLINIIMKALARLKENSRSNEKA